MHASCVDTLPQDGANQQSIVGYVKHLNHRCASVTLLYELIYTLWCMLSAVVGGALMPVSS